MATSFLYWTDLAGEESCTEYNKVKTPNGIALVNAWHTQGRSSNTVVSPLCQLVRSKLARKDDLPIYIGPTGYIQLESRELPECWTVDDLGRTVFVFDDCIYFQRYVSGECVVRTKLSTNDWNAITKEEEQELVSKLNR